MKNILFIIENDCTLCELRTILLYNYLLRPSYCQDFISPKLWLTYIYLKLSSHADKSEVEEGSKGCPILFCQHLWFLLHKLCVSYQYISHMLPSCWKWQTIILHIFVWTFGMPKLLCCVFHLFSEFSWGLMSLNSVSMFPLLRSAHIFQH